MRTKERCFSPYQSGGLVRQVYQQRVLGPAAGGRLHAVVDVLSKVLSRRVPAPEPPAASVARRGCLTHSRWRLAAGIGGSTGSQLTRCKATWRVGELLTRVCGRLATTLAHAVNKWQQSNPGSLAGTRGCTVVPRILDINLRYLSSWRVVFQMHKGSSR